LVAGGVRPWWPALCHHQSVTVQTLLLILKLLPLVLAIVREIQRRRLTAEAADELIAEMNARGEVLVARAIEARASVDTSPEAIDADPFNRD
jgi:hypothetical protein